MKVQIFKEYDFVYHNLRPNHPSAEIELNSMTPMELYFDEHNWSLSTQDKGTYKSGKAEHEYLKFIGLISYDVDSKCFILEQDVSSLIKDEPLSLILSKGLSIPNGVPIQEGSLLQFGSVKFLVKNIQINTSSFSQSVDESDRTINNSYRKKPQIQEESIILEEARNEIYQPKKGLKAPSCRYCFSDEWSVSNTLLNICACSGSIVFIHLDCLRKWIKSKSVVKQLEKIKMIAYEDLYCELCHKKLPDEFIYNSKKYSLIVDESTDKSFIAIQYTLSEQNQGLRYYTYFLYFDDIFELSIGRSSESSVTLNNNTVSRDHATLILRNDQVFVRDQNSKFGTAVSFTEALHISSTTYLKLGNYYLKFQVNVPCWLQICSKPNQQFVDYIKLFSRPKQFVSKLPCFTVDIRDYYVEETIINTSSSLENSKIVITDALNNSQLFNQSLILDKESLPIMLEIEEDSAEGVQRMRKSTIFKSAPVINVLCKISENHKKEKVEFITSGLSLSLKPTLNLKINQHSELNESEKGL